MIDVIGDSTLYELGYPYLALWFVDINVRMEMEPRFPMSNLLAFLKEHSSKTFRELALYIIMSSPIEHRVEYGGLSVFLDRITEHYVIFTLTCNKKRLVLTATPSAKIFDLVAALNLLKKGKASIKTLESSWKVYIPTSKFFECLRFDGPRFVEKKLKEVVVYANGID